MIENVCVPVYILRAFTGDEIGKLKVKGDDYVKNCVGYVRGDFGRNGAEFWHTWWPNREELNTPEFKAAFDSYVNWLREGVLMDYPSMQRFCETNPEACITFAFGPTFGFATESGRYSFYLRCVPRKNDYNFYIFCYLNREGG